MHLVLKHFTIGLLLELWQQLIYKQAKTFDETTKVVEKEENMAKNSQQTMQSMTKVVHFSIELELWTHPKVNFCMELTMD